MIPEAPPTQDFLYPSIGNGCLADGGNSIATALSVAGPAEIPKPAAPAGPDRIRVHRGRYSRTSRCAEIAAQTLRG